MAQHKVTQRILTIMDMIIKEREHVKSRSAMARSLDYSPQSFDKVTNDDRNFPIDVIHRFFEKYNINPSLVFNDELWKRHSVDNHVLFQSNTDGVMETSFYVDIENTIRVAMISIENAKRYAIKNQDEEYIGKLSFMSFHNSDEEYRSLRGFQIKGDDMEPNFFHGDWVFGLRVRKFTKIRLNRIFVIVLKYEVVIRRITAFNEESNSLTVSMDNHAYPDYEISLENVFEVWEVESALKSRFPMPK
ncbi:hypothetical protein ATE84_2307 [Aquimarina sp. MAR_2010_214]|uniref:S24 family peptidase n=1 Tax=Aquimarina sp. MAR_2010_214 TaxID=1250026 RepID=UPI000C702132|nr:S24 family peptidase [Aquimarina sp. MAR_2010_214]PKV50252.1 hypothetical protein ATE84_2307 [Aquimarina sp. MAR_2010_214]